MGDDYDLPDRVPCPFCDGVETELHSPFGTALSVATYWCRDCHTAFEWVKWRGVAGGAGETGAARDGGAGEGARRSGAEERDVASSDGE